MRSAYFALIFGVMFSSAYAGVSLDLVRTDAEGNETERTRISSQGGKLRMDSDGGPFSSAVSMIFLGDRFLVVDHDEKNYIIMDEAMLNEVSVKMNEAMKQMEAQLAKMPPEQREMAEQMMKGQMSALESLRCRRCRICSPRRRPESSPWVLVNGMARHARATPCSKGLTSRRTFVLRRSTRSKAPTT